MPPMDLPNSRGGPQIARRQRHREQHAYDQRIRFHIAGHDFVAQANRGLVDGAGQNRAAYGTADGAV